MKKELFFAVFIGLAFGLLITYGIYTARSSILPEKDPLPSPSPSASAAPVQSDLVVIVPEDEQATLDETVTVTGTAAPNAFVSIVTENVEELINSDDQGKFSREIPLEIGANIIVVTAIDQDGARAQSERTVIRLQEALRTTTEETNQATNSSDATSSSSESQ